MSPTQRTLALLRERGYLVQVVEYYHAFSRRRVDLFGYIDIVALDGLPGVLGVQTTTAANLSNRMRKLKTECAGRMCSWLEHGNRLIVHGWALRGPRGCRKRWSVDERVITLATFD